MKLCFEFNDGAYPIKLEQRSEGTFRLTYGSQVMDRLLYTKAALELGTAIMHSTACEGKLDNISYIDNIT